MSDLPSSDGSARARVGYVVLGLGMMLVLWAWGSWIYRASSPPRANVTTQVEGAPDSATQKRLRDEDVPKAVKTLPFFLMSGFVLVLVFLFGSWALARALRQYRYALQRKKPAPTDARDVWAMHKLPDDADRDR